VWKRRIEADEVPIRFEDDAFLMCHQCSECSGVCPSERQGGINPREVVLRYSAGIADPMDKDLWLCTMCHSCSERCQLDVRPAELIASLREEGALAGSCPRSFQEEAKLFLRTGLSFPNTGMTKKIRKEIGLVDIVQDARTVQDVSVIASRTRMGRLKLE